MITIFERESRPSSELPASRIPERADRYVCDICGRDVTRKVRKMHGHSGPIIGPERFTCSCGARYLSGMTEWDHLRPSIRGRRIKFSIIAAGLVIPLVFFVVYARAAWLDSTPFLFVLLCVGAVIASPFALFGAWALLDVYSIVASIYRTRIGGSRR